MRYPKQLLSKLPDSNRILISCAAILFAALLVGVLLLHPFRNSPDIRSDGVGYHVWAHAIARGDFTFCNYKPMLQPVTALSGESADGLRCKNKYPPGVGLLQLVFSWPVLADDPVTTGFSVGENRVVFWGGGVLLFATTGLLYSALRRSGTASVPSLIGIVAFVFGTGLFHYATYDASFSHVYSAFGVALLLWLAYGMQHLSLRRLIAFSVIAAWLYIVRQTNAALSLAVVYVFVRQTGMQGLWRLPAAWFIGTGTAAAVLLAYSRYVTGEASFSSYGSEGFPSFAGHSLEVLFSYERGLFSYYPVFMVGVALAILQRKNAVSQAFLSLIAIFALLYGSWHAWHLGAGFGHRGFVELAPFGVVIVANALQGARPLAKGFLFAVIGLCCLATTLAMAAYWRGDLPFTGAGSTQYWRSISPVKLSFLKDPLYSKKEIRRIHLTFQSVRKRDDGHWQVRILVANGNESTPLRGAGGPYPVLRLSWRLVAPRAGLSEGWDARYDLPAIDAGLSRSVTVDVPDPDITDADLQLQFSIVQEGYFWAHDVGVPPLSISWGRDQVATLNKTE
ncbi:hypothetical protein [Luteibacter sp. 9133]|uniref:hypothetical protein n=1 Tax=Luteibacter sp. 9133 TaxID=1500891 RepID=UPI0005B9DB59|nr:hypothetical protein [Luteibacter sp. 9133]